MNRTDVRRLMLPDDEIPAEARARVKERVMASVRKSVTVPDSRRARFQRRLVPALLAFSVVLVGAAAGFALGVFPQQVQSDLQELGCRDSTSVEQLVATADLPSGGMQQFWITKVAENSPPNGHILIEIGPDGAYRGFSFGCGPPSLVVEATEETTFAGVASDSSLDGTLMYVLGHVPPEAVTAVVTFDDGTMTSIDVETDGYFLGLVERPDLVTDSQGNVRVPEPTHVEALGANGMVVLELDL